MLLSVSYRHRYFISLNMPCGETKKADYKERLLYAPSIKPGTSGGNQY